MNGKVKVLITLLIAVTCVGCGTSNLARMERLGQTAGTVAVDYVYGEWGGHSEEAEKLAEIGRDFDRAAGLLASENPISATDRAEIESLIRRSAIITTAGEPVVLITRDLLADLLAYVRNAELDIRYRAYAAQFLRSTADAIYERLRLYVPERSAP